MTDLLAEAKKIIEMLAEFEFDKLRTQLGYDKALKAHCALKRRARAWLAAHTLREARWRAEPPVSFVEEK